MSDFRPVVYAASVEPLKEEALYARAYAAVSPERRQKADRFRFAADRRLSLGAALLLRCALRAEGLPVPSGEVVYGEQGKPFWKDSALHFNLSHSGEYALCALAPCEVGCDIAQITPIDLALARRFFTRAEYEAIAAQETPEAQRELFFRCWALKESFLKATGLGLKLPLNAFSFVLGESVSVVQAVDRRSYTFAEFADLPGYRCALCAAGDCTGAALHVLDLRAALG